MCISLNHQNENKIPFREAVGALIFISIVSRPDISYSVNQVSRFVNNFDENHWNAVKKIIKYLKGTKHYGILFQRTEDPFQLTGWSDSDQDSRRSTIGYLFLLNGGLLE